MHTPTAPILYFENAAGRLLQDPAGFLRIVWGSQPRQFEDTRALFTHQFLALKRYGWSRILIDQRQMSPFTRQEQDWATQIWLPQAIREGGYRHGALMVSADVMVRLATSFVTTQVVGLPLMYRSFEQEEDALAWLLQQPASAVV